MPSPPTANSPSDEDGDIVVTGTLIQNPNLVTSSPVTSLDADEIEYRQVATAEELLRPLPGNVPDNGASVNNGNNGSFYVNLRGLGSFRNVVLLDGVRLTPSRDQGDVDLNNIPLALVERVDALTGGAVTTYGADAMTGVVNFITRRNFEGAEFRVADRISEHGDAKYFSADATVGANFADGRGNTVLSLGYQNSGAAFYSKRRFADPLINSFTGATISSTIALPARFTVPGRSVQELTPNGDLVNATSVYDPGPFGTFQTPFKRFNVYGSARYELADGIEFYSRALYSRNEVRLTIDPSGPSGLSVQIPFSNPFLPAAARAVFCANSDSNPNLAGTQTLTPAQCAAAAAATNPSDPNYRTFTTAITRRTPETGFRLKDFTTQFYDVRAGFRGSLADNLHWDVWGAYGKSENTQLVKGFLLVSRTRQSLLATSPTTCLDPTNGCVPANFFGPDGSISPAAADFLVQDNAIFNNASLLQGRATISGDFGLASPLATSPIGIAAGLEYRRYRAEEDADALARLGSAEIIGRGRGAPHFEGGYDVREAFAELNVPVVEDRPFFENLTVDAGIRQSRYSVDTAANPTFDTTTWKVGGSWEPGEGIKFRGSYAHAVRAPSVLELFAPNSVALTNISRDPCAGSAPVGDANLRAVCIAQGAPASTIGLITFPVSGLVNSTGGGNPNVKPETAKTYTLGLVLQPDVLPNFAFTIDYYNIKVLGAIFTPSPADVINGCFGNVTSASASDPRCLIIRRNPVTGELFGDQATTPGLFQGRSNAGRLSTSGVDVTANYRHRFGFGTLDLEFIGNYTHSQKAQATPSDVNRECAGYYSGSCGLSESIQPKYQWSQRTTLAIDPVEISLLWRHIGSIRYEPLAIIEDGGLTPFSGALPGFGQQDFGRIGAYDAFDLTTRFDVTRNLVLTLTVMNLLDRRPPLVGNNLASPLFNVGNTFPSTYDAIGRRYAVAARFKF